MKFSVVTISYNQCDYLGACIESVLAQVGPEVEYIVVDAGSTDGSLELIERYRAGIEHLVVGEDRGPPDGLNKGFALATGDVFYFLNSDDLVLPGAFARAAELFAHHPDVDVLYGNGLLIDEAGKRIRSSLSIPWFSPYRYLSGAGAVHQQATFFRSSVFRRAGGFNLECGTCWDGELLLDMALMNAKFMHVAEEWGAFRITPTSISGSGRLDARYAVDRRRMFRKVYGRDADWREFVFRYAYRAVDKPVSWFRSRAALMKVGRQSAGKN